MKSVMYATAAVVLMAATPVNAFNFGDTTNNYGGQGGDASASASAGAVAGASANSTNRNTNKNYNTNTNVNTQGQLQGQGQGQVQGQSVDISTPQFTYGVHGVIGSSNNSPCGRVTIAVPNSGHNCTAREEANLWMVLGGMYRSPDALVREAARAAIVSWAMNDTTARKTARALGYIK